MWLNFIFRRTAPVPFLESILIKEAKKESLRFQRSLFDSFSYGFVVGGEREPLLRFSENLSKNLPLSLFFFFIKVEPLEGEPLSLETLAENPAQGVMDFTPLEMEAFLPKEGERSLRSLPWRVSFWLQGEKRENLEGEVLYEAFEALAKKVLEGESILITTRRGLYQLSLKGTKKTQKGENKPLFMPLDVASAELLFRVCEPELNALATWEKPRIELAPKGVFLDRFEGALYPESGVEVLLPYDLPLMILSHFLRAHEVEMVVLERALEGEGEGLFYENSEPLESLKVCVSDDSTVLVTDRERGGLIPDYSTLISKLLEENHLHEGALALHLSHHAPSYFWLIQGEARRSVMRFELPLNPALLWQEIAQSGETGESLTQNFSREFSELAKRIQNSQTQGVSENLNDWVGMAGFFLGLQEEWNPKGAQEVLWSKAKAFLGAKGPRVDFPLKKEESGRVGLDAIRVIRSCMSFKLAGIDDETLAFGVIDSLAEFWGNLLRDMSENFAQERVILSGSLLANRAFLNKILQYTPKHLQLHFPLQTPLDFVS